MRAIWVILAARSRSHWRGWLVLTLLVMIGTGAVLTAVTAGRRADSAFPRYVASHGYDAIVYSSEPVPLAHLPSVASVVQLAAPFFGTIACSCGKTINQGDFAVREVPTAALPQVSRRRRESGLLKSLGLIRGQLAAIVCWQATTVAIVGVAVGIPLGLAVGRVSWTTFAANLGVIPVAIIPAWLIAAIAAGFVATALAIAVLPAVAAARTSTSNILRAE